MRSLKVSRITSSPMVRNYFTTRGPGFKLIRDILFTFLLLTMFFHHSQASAAETAVINIILNQESKGEYFLKLAGPGEFLVRAEDLKAMGFRKPVGNVIDVDGEGYLSLKSMEGVEYIFNEKTVSLEITANPWLLGRSEIDFMPQRPRKVYYPKDTSAFLNYGLTYSHDEFSSTTLTNELGARGGDLLFLTDSTYTNSPKGNKFLRLMSNITYDRRSTLQRLVAGDFFASSGELGSTTNLGGLSFSKLYRMDPYFIYRPLMDVSGVVSLPSEVDVYLDGMRIRTEKFSPGEFELRNITRHAGASTLELVIKDAFGREERLRFPFYFTDILLKRGLHEYSWNIGFQRENFGVESNSYGHPAFSAFHRYGVSDDLTFGLRGEGTRGLYNLGPQVASLLSKAGLATLSLSGSHSDANGEGLAGAVSYGYQGSRVSTRLLLRGFTKEYATLASPSGEGVKYELGAGVGYGTRELGSLSLDFTTTGKYVGEDRHVGTATYSRNLTANSTMFLTCRVTKERDYATEVFAGISFFPGKNFSISANVAAGNDANSENLQVQKPAPVGEGFGFRATLERAESASLETYAFNPFVQYNANHGILSGEFRGETGDAGSRQTYQATAAGGLAYVGDAFGFSRPISDSFGLVKVGEVAGVRVYQDNQEIGRSDSSGRLFIPNLRSYYDNQLSINDKDIPIDYSLSEVLRIVSPPYRSGSCIPFGVRKQQPLVGYLKVRENGKAIPLEYQTVTMRVDGKKITFPTGGGGEFYLDIGQLDGEDAPDGCAPRMADSLIKPGKYGAVVSYKGRQIPFHMTVPGTGAILIDLGEVVIELPPEHVVPAGPPQAEEKEPVPSLPKSQKTVEAAGKEVGPPPAPPVQAEPPGTLPVVESVPSLPQTGRSGEQPVTETGPFQPTPESGAELKEKEMEIYFRFDSTSFATSSDRATLLTLARLLKSNPDLRAEIEGHADQLGTHGYNYRLGRKRGVEVVEWLVREGVERRKIFRLTSFGKKRLKCRSLATNCRKVNRRVVIRLVPAQK